MNLLSPNIWVVKFSQRYKSQKQFYGGLSERGNVFQTFQNKRKQAETSINRKVNKYIKI